MSSGIDPVGETVRIAACACGQLRARCTGQPPRVSVCHCLDCKRRTGSAFAWNATYAAEQVVIEGPSSTFERRTESGHAAVHHFCPSCGSTLGYMLEIRPGMITVPAGAFADPEFPAPHVEVFEERRVGWCAVELV